MPRRRSKPTLLPPTTRPHSSSGGGRGCARGQRRRCRATSITLTLALTLTLTLALTPIPTPTPTPTPGAAPLPRPGARGDAIPAAARPGADLATADATPPPRCGRTRAPLRVRGAVRRRRPRRRAELQTRSGARLASGGNEGGVAMVAVRGWRWRQRGRPPRARETWRETGNGKARGTRPGRRRRNLTPWHHDCCERLEIVYK